MGKNSDERIEFLHAGTEAFAAAFGAFLEHTNEYEHARGVYQHYLESIRGQNLYVDIGPGDGRRFTRLAHQRFRRGLAIEPTRSFHNELRRNCPGIDISDDTVENLDTTTLGEVDLITLAHVLYYVQPRLWAGLTSRLVEKVNPGGGLILILQDAGTDYNTLYERFVGVRFDLPALAQEFLSTHPGWDLHSTQVPDFIRVADFDTAFQIAVFMLSYVPFEPLPTVAEVSTTVRSFWRPDEQKYVASNHQRIVFLQRTHF